MASIALNMYVNEDCTFDFDKLKEMSKIITYNLNKIIDVNYYPTPEVRLILCCVPSVGQFLFDGFSDLYSIPDQTQQLPTSTHRHWCSRLG